jgi:hypothetical protein
MSDDEIKAELGLAFYEPDDKAFVSLEATLKKLSAM